MTIVKVADPADDTEFNFSVAGGNVFVETLSNPSNPSFTFDLVDGNPATTVTEEVPPGWILDHIDCTTPNIGCGSGGLEPCLIITAVPNGLTFECLDVLGGPNTCTFFNDRIENVPTLSQWGLIAMAGILGIIGFMVIRRRKVTA
jgi:hypothetical protein